VSQPAAQPTPLPVPPRSIVTAVRRLLRPIVRLLLTHQITFPYLARLLKAVYVELAEREFRLEGRPQTTTRVSLLTGIHRKDVKRLRSELPHEEAPPPMVSLGAQLVAVWMGDPAYLDESGRPRRLARHAAAGEPVSFEGLVQSVSKDIRPRAVLDEWLNLGVARLGSDGRVELNTGAFTPDRGLDEKAFFFGRNLHDHVAAGVANLRGERPSHPDRAVYYDGLSAESVAELRTLAERLGMEALHAVNRRARELSLRDRDRSDAEQRMTFGIYFYAAPADPAGDRDAEGTPPSGEPEGGRLGA